MKQPGLWQMILQYLYLKKKDKDAPSNMNIRFMHGMNRISLLMFVGALILLIVKLFILRR